MRAQNWKNVFDAATGFARGKDTQGNWRTPFDPYALGHGADTANDFTEGNAFQYSWHVLHDVPGLVAAMGGKAAFAAKLDALFAAPETVQGAGFVLDVSGLIGQYAHGNEPSHHVAYLYQHVGRPDRTAEVVREIFDCFYAPKPDGLCGNDDCGQMSAWYVFFSALGFYPVDPASGEYVLGAPQIAKVRLRLPNGKTFTVMAQGLSRANKYVRRVTLSGSIRSRWRSGRRRGRSRCRGAGSCRGPTIRQATRTAANPSPATRRAIRLLSRRATTPA